MSHDDPATKKYHQTVVPDHALKPDTSGTSFLRTGTFPSLTDTTKQPPGFQKSLALARLAGDHHLKTGGSWHHVDGNRIETTTGRKVEVIAGSYVAHRGPGNSPGPNFSATWATSSYTEVGSLDTPIGWTPGPSAGTPSQSPGTPATEPSDNFVEGLSYGYDAFSVTMSDPNAHPVVEQTQLQAPAAPSSPNAISNNGLQYGDVVGVTWANRILTYQGSANQVVPLVYAETQAGTIVTKSYAHTGNITTFIHAVGDSSVVWQDTVGKAITTSNEAVGAITVTNTAANILTHNLGTQEVLNLAPVMLTATAAGAVFQVTAAQTVANVTAAAEIYNVNFGPQTVINVPEKMQFGLSEGKIVNTYDAAEAAHTALRGALINLADTVSMIHNGQVTIAGTTMQLGNGSTDLSEFIVKGV